MSENSENVLANAVEDQAANTLADANEQRADFVEQLDANLTGLVSSIELVGNEIEIRLTLSQLEDAMNRLRDSSALMFSTLLDMTAVDFPNRVPRFDMVYFLSSMKYNQRVRVKMEITAQDLVPSVTSIWSTANWYEREVWDMYGIMFSGHPDLRRLLSDYGFDGHPLRKDFPLTGYVEVRYDSEQGRVVYEPVKLQQEMRNFDYSSPWEGMSLEAPLPGDEKAALDSNGGAS